MNSPIATATDRTRALAAAALIASPDHRTRVAAEAVHGRIACRASCPCGWDAIRPNPEEAELEAAVHRLDPAAWRQADRSEAIAAGGDEFWETDPADLPSFRTEAA
ncbi:hypothetical protein O4J56_06830 [Nocardiopsis sp. RSe5-2]|uniref:Uncharacterized protein n=1 Tax=Nocardiopsis endophytica TaxID=3018445 RepID=A0ABT4U1H6_9ACTN|nr:hypothetical protein [Nocardiopsis endophytica]MDA2810349.1 hypothetical protein [Nocardiopsis endophytica]